MIYLATPYGHSSKAVRDQRTMQARVIAAWYASRNVPVFSPIAYGHAIRECLPADRTHQDWMRFDISFLRRALFLYVAKMPGWDVSPGVTEEIRFAENRDIPISYISKEEIFKINAEMGYADGQNYLD